MLCSTAVRSPALAAAVDRCGKSGKVARLFKAPYIRFAPAPHGTNHAKGLALAPRKCPPVQAEHPEPLHGALNLPRRKIISLHSPMIALPAPVRKAFYGFTKLR